MNKRNPVLYFCDEAGTKEPNVAVGGLAILLRDAIHVDQQLKAIRAEVGARGEIKWANAKRRRDSVHREYARFLRKLCQIGVVDFHMNFIPMSQYHHRISGQRGKIDTLSKQYFNLLLHRAIRYYGANFPIHVRLDSGEYTELLPEFHRVLNVKAWEWFEYENPIETIRCRISNEANFLQFLDVTLGAFAALRNERYANDALSFKASLANEIWQLWDGVDLCSNTPIQERRFNVWNISPSL